MRLVVGWGGSRVVYKLYKKSSFCGGRLPSVPFHCNECINEKIDRFVKSLYYLIINHCTGLNWSDWCFKRSLKLLFTDDQLHTSLTDEILMKN